MAFIDYTEYGSVSLVGIRIDRAMAEALSKKGLVVYGDPLDIGYVYDCHVKPEILKRFEISFRGNLAGVILLEKKKRDDPGAQCLEMSAADAIKKIEAATASVLAFLDFLGVEKTEVRLYFRAGSCAFGD